MLMVGQQVGPWALNADSTCWTDQQRPASLLLLLLVVVVLLLALLHVLWRWRFRSPPGRACLLVARVHIVLWLLRLLARLLLWLVCMLWVLCEFSCVKNAAAS
jgi:hypothetical protein